MSVAGVSYRGHDRPRITCCQCYCNWYSVAVYKEIAYTTTKIECIFNFIIMLFDSRNVIKVVHLITFLIG